MILKAFQTPERPDWEDSWSQSTVFLRAFHRDRHLRQPAGYPRHAESNRVETLAERWYRPRRWRPSSTGPWIAVRCSGLDAHRPKESGPPLRFSRQNRSNSGPLCGLDPLSRSLGSFSRCVTWVRRFAFPADGSKESGGSETERGWMGP